MHQVDGSKSVSSSVTRWLRGFWPHLSPPWYLPTRWGIDPGSVPWNPIDQGGGPVWSAGGMLQLLESRTCLWRPCRLPCSACGNTSIQGSIPLAGPAIPGPRLPGIWQRYRNGTENRKASKHMVSVFRDIGQLQWTTAGAVPTVS